MALIHEIKKCQKISWHCPFKYCKEFFFLFLFSASAILASLSRSCRTSSTGSAPRRRTSRGTVGGPPAPPAPRKFFNDQTFNQCCGSASIIMRISVAEPERSEPVLFGWSRSRCKDVKAKTCFFLLFSLFLHEKELEPEPVKKKYLEPEPVKKGPAPQHWCGFGSATLLLMTELLMRQSKVLFSP